MGRRSRCLPGAGVWDWVLVPVSVRVAAVDALTGELIGRTVPGGAGEVMALVTRPAGGVRGCQGDAVRPVRPVSGGPGERGRPPGGGALQAAAP